MLNGAEHCVVKPSNTMRNTCVHIILQALECQHSHVETMPKAFMHFAHHKDLTAAAVHVHIFVVSRAEPLQTVKHRFFKSQSLP